MTTPAVPSAHSRPVTTSRSERAPIRSDVKLAALKISRSWAVELDLLEAGQPWTDETQQRYDKLLILDSFLGLELAQLNRARLEANLKTSTAARDELRSLLKSGELEFKTARARLYSAAISSSATPPLDPRLVELRARLAQAKAAVDLKRKAFVKLENDVGKLDLSIDLAAEDREEFELEEDLVLEEENDFACGERTYGNDDFECVCQYHRSIANRRNLHARLVYTHDRVAQLAARKNQQLVAQLTQDIKSIRADIHAGREERDELKRRVKDVKRAIKVGESEMSDARIQIRQVATLTEVEAELQREEAVRAQLTIDSDALLAEAALCATEKNSIRSEIDELNVQAEELATQFAARQLIKASLDKKRLIPALPTSSSSAERLAKLEAAFEEGSERVRKLESRLVDLHDRHEQLQARQKALSACPGSAGKGDQQAIGAKVADMFGQVSRALKKKKEATGEIERLSREVARGRWSEWKSKACEVEAQVKELQVEMGVDSTQLADEAKARMEIERMAKLHQTFNDQIIEMNGVVAGLRHQNTELLLQLAGC